MITPQKISWTATEYEHNHKEPDWFWALWIIAVSGSVAAFIYGNVLFSFLIILSAFAIATHANKKPSPILFEVSEKGVRSGGVLYPYENLEAFCISEDSNNKKLLLQSTRLLMPLLVIPLGDIDQENLSVLLKEFLEEKTLHEPIAQKIFENFGF